MQEGEVSFVSGEDNWQRNSDVIIYLDVGKGRGMLLILSVMENQEIGDVTRLLMWLRVGHGSIKYFPVFNDFFADGKVNSSTTA